MTPTTSMLATTIADTPPRTDLSETPSEMSTKPAVTSTSLSNMANARPPAHLLGIPSELRNQIWHQVIASDKTIEVDYLYTFQGHFPTQPRTRRFSNMTPPLTTVSRQVRNETRRMFLEENDFDITRACLRDLSNKAFTTFLALCAGSELRSVQVVIIIQSGAAKHYGNMRLHSEITVVNVNNGLEIRDVDYSQNESVLRRMTYGRVGRMCGCGIIALAAEFKGQKYAIVRFLEALRREGESSRKIPLAAGFIGRDVDRIKTTCTNCPGSFRL